MTDKYSTPSKEAGVKIQASERVVVGYTQVVSVGGTWDLLPEVFGLYRKEGGLSQRGEGNPGMTLAAWRGKVTSPENDYEFQT